MSRHTIYEKVEEDDTLAPTFIRRFIRLKSGRELTFWDAVSAANAARTAFSTAISRAYKLAGEDTYSLERIDRIIDDMESYIGSVRQWRERLREIKAEEERIAALRMKTVAMGATPGEARLASAKADELQAKLDERKKKEYRYG